MTKRIYCKNCRYFDRGIILWGFCWKIFKKEKIYNAVVGSFKTKKDRIGTDYNNYNKNGDCPH